MKALLKQGPLFAALSDAQLDRITRHARRISLQSGESLFEQGEAADRFYLVISGQIKLYRLSPNGNEKVVEIVTPGCTFAEALMFLQRPTYPVGAEALTAAEVISIDARDFTKMLRESTDTCFLLLGDLSQRLRGLLREIDELSLYSATCRVAGYLLEAGPDDANEFELPVAKQILASRLSVKPETFSRILKNLNESGVVTIKNSRVQIHDRERLRETANICATPQERLAASFLYPCPPSHYRSQG
ncbi:MAG: Crp/Fnr family transcriptional regulator [Gammaproteobacteria bacterium]|nr:MAG: Crp/Fnr family transcriptional regulator [Gammaproteobacteria bacterium]